MTKISNISVEHGIGILEIDSPPVNALNIDVRRALYDGFSRLDADLTVRAIVLIFAGRTFSAGADIREFGTAVEPPFISQVFEIIESSAKPIIAAIHGTALGGGYELALVCHHRIAVPSAFVGLPEVKLGLLPGAGGTQRLTRVVGVEAALDIMTGGNLVPAVEAMKLGMIDALADERRLREDAVAFSAQLVSAEQPLLLVRDRQDQVAPARGKTEIYNRYLKQYAKNWRGLKAPFAILKAIEAAAELPFDEGLRVETQLSVMLQASPESKALQYCFFAERGSSKRIGMEALLKRKKGAPIDRMLGVLLDAANFLRQNGTTQQQIDESLYSYGFSMDFLSSRQASISRRQYSVRKHLSQSDIIDGLLSLVVNEGMLILEEMKELRASDLDIAMVLGGGWPRYTGGPMYWADRKGLAGVLANIEEMGVAPSNWLICKARDGHTLTMA